MLLAITQTHDGAIAQRLARRLNLPCRDAEGLTGPPAFCILVEGPGQRADDEARVLIHHGEADDLAGYDLTVNSARLGEDATVELLSQFVALKVMSHRHRAATGGRLL